MKKYAFRTSFRYNGKRYWVRADSEPELAAKKALKLRDLKDGKIVTNCNTTVKDWVDKCIDTYKPNQSELTKQKYRDRVRHCIIDEIGGLKLSQVTPATCQRVINLQAGKSRTQVNTVFQALRFIFRHAVADGLLATDPTENLVKPRAKKQETRRALTQQERRYMTQVATSDRRFWWLLLMLYCGCRPSEAVACRGYDLSAMNGYNVLHIRGAKTAQADRFVPVPDVCYNVIKNAPENEYICLYHGKPLDSDGRRRAWKAFKRQVNIAMGCKVYRNQLVPPFPLADDLYPYCLRHEFCTDLARRGIDLRVAQKLMGHASVTLTANIYTNLTASDALCAAQALGATKGATAE